LEIGDHCLRAWVTVLFVLVFRASFFLRDLGDHSNQAGLQYLGIPPPPWATSFGHGVNGGRNFAFGIVDNPLKAGYPQRQLIFPELSVGAP
jgi:hypothetical protein